jgi:hypothetical protein
MVIPKKLFGGWLYLSIIQIKVRSTDDLAVSTATGDPARFSAGAADNFFQQ